MKARLAVLGCGLAIFLTGLVQGGDSKSDKKALQGTWTVTEGDKKGVFHFEGDKFTVTFEDDQPYKGTFKLDGSKKPKAIDMMIKKGEKYVGMTAQAIYKIEKNKLTWCASEPGNDRPTEFVQSDGTLLLVLERKKKE